jgi:hypothetical protein
VKIGGGRLLLNVDTGALGRLRVGLVGVDGKPLPGFGADDCDPVWINATGAVVSWRGNADLSALRDRERTKLYSFRFE